MKLTMTRICSSLLALILFGACLLPSFAVLNAAAEEETVLAEESFDDYDIDVAGDQTSLKSFFQIDANSIGDGYVKIKEDDTGNLLLQSHVFTQVYFKNALKVPYAFSLTAYEMQGGHQSGMFFRAPVNQAAYYEGDGGDPERGNSCGFSGIWLYAYETAFEVNVKTYDDKQAHKVKDNTLTFDMPEGSGCSNGMHCDIRIVDDIPAGKAAVYVDGHLMCTFEFSEEVVKRGYSGVGVSVACSSSVTVKDASGEVLATYEKPIVSSAQSFAGWATRVANMSVDNVRVAQIPSEAASEQTTPAATQAVTEPVTDPVTSPETQPQASATEQETAPATGEQVSSTEEVTDAGTDTEVRVIDDSLAVWILVAVMLVAVGATVGVILMKKKRD